MIESNKEQNALCALQSLLVRLRFQAFESNQPEIAMLLDSIEILPKYIGEKEDRTYEYRVALECIAEENLQYSHALELFDRKHLDW